MNHERYPVIATDQFRSFEFLSDGPNGTIKKVVFFEDIGDGVYNLAFGDWDELGQRINDKARSNNDDRDKVVATVASTVVQFINHYPRAFVIARGSTPARTRLYQIGILNNWAEITAVFNIAGFINGNWEPLRRNTNYHAFIVRKKENL